LASSTKQVQESTAELPEGVTASLGGRVLTVSGQKGKASKDFERINVDIKLEGNKVIVIPFSTKKKDNVVVNTVLSLIRNMSVGVSKGYTYRLKVVYAHFPITIKTKGDEILVENFVGERSPRIAKIVGECKATVEGDDLVIKGISLEDVGQTAANVELATKIKKKDQRIFLDGVYIYQKEEGS
jgi:large subunit ribosomal protein L6